MSSEVLARICTMPAVIKDGNAATKGFLGAKGRGSGPPHTQQARGAGRILYSLRREREREREQERERARERERERGSVRPVQTRDPHEDGFGVT